MTFHAGAVHIQSKGKNRSSILIALILMILPASTLYSQDHCSDVLQAGIFNTSDRATQDEQAASFANWFCSQQFKKASDAEQFGASLGFPFKGLPVRLGFDFSTQSFSEFKSAFCQDVRSGFSRRQTLEEHIKEASPAILAAFQSCINRKGAEVFIEHTADPTVFGYAVKFDSPSSKIPSIVVKLTIPESVTCDPDAKSVTVESPKTFRSVCTRHDDKLVKLAANSSDFDLLGGDALVLDAIQPRAVTPPPSILTIAANPVNIDFTNKNHTQVPGCSCGNNEITFPGDFSGTSGQPITFRYDGSEICRGQGFRNFDGIISWNGTITTPMANRNDNNTFPGIAGTLKVTFSQPGSFNVHASFNLDCIDINCSQRCSAQGNTTLVIH